VDEIKERQRSRRILVVEDDESLRRVITRNLEARGYDVLESETAADALTKIVEQPPDLIVLDILLPDRSGWDVLRRLERYQQRTPGGVSAAGVSPEAFSAGGTPQGDRRRQFERKVTRPGRWDGRGGVLVEAFLRVVALFACFVLAFAFALFRSPLGCIAQSRF
jgi:CheY-like chemotaxis protein